MRVAEQKHFSEDTVPADRTVLVMDLACDPDDERFTATDDALRDLVISGLRASGLSQHQPTDFWTKRFRYAYPIYDLTSAGLATLHAWADSRPNAGSSAVKGSFCTTTRTIRSSWATRRPMPSASVGVGIGGRPSSTPSASSAWKIRPLGPAESPDGKHHYALVAPARDR